MTGGDVGIWSFRILWFYCFWYLIRQGQIAIRIAQDALARNDELEASRLLMLKDLNEAVARQEARQAHIAEELEERNAVLAHGVANKTAETSKHVEQTLATIKKQLDENMDATVKAAEASAEAAQVANHVNDKILKVDEKIVTTRDDLVQKLEDLFKTAKPHRGHDD